MIVDKNRLTMLLCYRTFYIGVFLLSCLVLVTGTHNVPITQETDLKKSLRIALCDQAVAIRDRRRLVEERWLRSRRTWMAYPTSHIREQDSGVGNYNIPSARRVLERTAVRMIKMLTPTVKWFEISPMGEFDQETLSNVDNFMWYVLRKRIKSRSNISQLARCLLLYGMPVLKTSISVKNGQVWPSQRAVDPFAFYMYPETSPTIDDAEVVFEDFLFSYERYRTFADKGIVDDMPQSAFSKPDWPYHLLERLAYQGITDPSAGVDVDIVLNKVETELRQTSAAYVSMTEMWMMREDKLYQVYIAWNLKNSGPRIVGFFQSQYDQPLYRILFHRPLPGESYTTAQAEDIVELDGIQSDMFNLFVNSTDREQGMVAYGGSDGIRRDSIKFKGGAKWDFGSEAPRDVMQFLQPPVTSTNQLRAWQIVQGMMQSMGGSGTIAEGQPGRNMPRAGGAMMEMVNLSMADVKDGAELLEGILTDGLSDIYKVSSFIPDSQLMKIPGGKVLYHGSDKQSNILKSTNIKGDYEFEWIGSQQFQEESQRAERGMQFLQALPQLLPYLQQQGYTVNFVELLQFTWRYVLGERGLNKVVIQMPPAMQQQLQQQAQQQQSGKSAQPLPVSANGTR